MRNVCSMSKRRRNACQSRSTSAVVAAGCDHHSQTGFAVAPDGSRSTVSRMDLAGMLPRHRILSELIAVAVASAPQVRRQLRAELRAALQDDAD